jgi:hypothetical protein
MASQKQRWKRRRNATDKSAYPMSRSIRVWINYHPFTVARMWNAASRIVAHLQSHPRLTVVRFEDLIEDSENTVRILCGKLGVSYAKELLDVGQINSSHQSSVGGARRGLQKDAIDKWRKELGAGEVSIAERCCGKYMASFGYSLQNPKKAGRLSHLRYKISYPIHILGVFIVNPHRAWIQLQALMKRMRSSSCRS